MKNLVFIGVLLLSLIGNSQNINFIKSYGNTGYDVGKDIKQDLDSGYIATGSSSSFTSAQADVFLLKVDSIGDFQWSYNYGGPGSDWGEKVLLTPDTGYAIGGYTNSFGAGGFDFYLVKTNKFGTPEWEKTYGGSDWDQAHGLAVMADSGYVIVGETYSFGNGSTDIYIVRTDKFGDTIWTRTYGGLYADFANDVILDGDSLVIVGGGEQFGTNMTDGLILKYHIDGTFGWAKYVGKEKNDFFTSIVLNSPQTEYFIGGSRMYYFDQTGNLDDFWIYNVTVDGLSVLADTSITAGSHEVEVAYDIAVDNTDNIFFVGETKSFGYATLDFEKDAFAGKLLNNYYWSNYANNFGEAGEDVAYGMDICWDYGVAVTGKIAYGSLGGGNMFIARIDRLNTQGAMSVDTEMTYDNITLSFETLLPSFGYKVYPTEFTDYIQLEGFPYETTIAVYTLKGQLIFEQQNIDNQIDLSTLNSGLYIATFTTESGNYSQKLIKH